MSNVSHHPARVSEDLFADIDEYDINALRRLITRLELPLNQKQVNVCHALTAGVDNDRTILKKYGYSVANTTTVMRRLLSNIHFANLWTAGIRLAQLEHGVSAGTTRAVLVGIMQSKTTRDADRINAAKEINKMDGHTETKGSGNTTIVFNHPVLALHGESGSGGTVIDGEITQG